jgi:hypothetical protein
LTITSVNSRRCFITRAGFCGIGIVSSWPQAISVLRIWSFEGKINIVGRTKSIIGTIEVNAVVLDIQQSQETGVIPEYELRFYAARPEWFDTQEERDAFVVKYPELVEEYADCWQSSDNEDAVA